jgi:FKBP-type peptidyl-prolyl cis-trans isomerase SlyD
MRPQIVSFKCTLKNRTGQLISTTYNHEVLTALENEEKNLLSGLAKQMQNLKKGEKRTITLKAEDAYGLYDLKKVILIPRNKLSKTVRLGEIVLMIGKSGLQKSYRVLELFPHFVNLDGNHPLAGQDLIFEIETLDARYATKKEIDDSVNAVASQLLH